MINGTIIFISNGTTVLSSVCEIANEKLDKIKGLSGKTLIEIPMVFPEDEKSFVNYTMKEMICPIFIMFFNKRLRCSYFRKAFPGEEVFYYGEPVRFVVECPVNWESSYNFKNCEMSLFAY